MKILPEPVEFEWDRANRDKNLIKHNVTNKEAEEVFQGENVFIFKDETHSQLEERFGLFGETKKGSLLSVTFTIRRNKIRIITARDMSKRERREYEKIKKAQDDSKI